jgi:hypothetical protein
MSNFCPGNRLSLATHSFYFLYLIPSAFFLFGHVKNCLQGIGFLSHEEFVTGFTQGQVTSRLLFAATKEKYQELAPPACPDLAEMILTGNVTQKAVDKSLALFGDSPLADIFSLEALRTRGSNVSQLAAIVCSAFIELSRP